MAVFFGDKISTGFLLALSHLPDDDQHYDVPPSRRPVEVTPSSRSRSFIKSHDSIVLPKRRCDLSSSESSKSSSDNDDFTETQVCQLSPSPSPSVHSRFSFIFCSHISCFLFSHLFSSMLPLLHAPSPPCSLSSMPTGHQSQFLNITLRDCRYKH